MSNQSCALTSTRNLVLLAPASARSCGPFDHIWRSNQTYTKLLSDMQRLRGEVYLHDGAVERHELTSDGRHIVPSDEHSWHLLTLNSAGRVLGCIRYSRASVTGFGALNVGRAALTKSKSWGPLVRSCVLEEARNARSAGFSYLEIGGWALAKELRGTAEAVRGVLTTYAFAQWIGGALGVTTATERNQSSSMLRRLGARALEWDGTELPSYYDEQYRCQMEILRFDSRSPNPKYLEHVKVLRDNISKVPVVSRKRPSASRTFVSQIPLGSKLLNFTDGLLAVV